MTVQSPQPLPTETFTDAAAAVARLEEIYERNTAYLRGHFEAYANGVVPAMRIRATYPFVRLTTASHARLDSRLAYGFVAG
ncbi:MAG: AMP nucleosidase, partial [Bradyrhizobium sp.]|nr:AMP nucleosidase [Bradyrhizobium sp.]